MAVSDLLPRKKTKSRSRLQTMRDRIGYDMKEEKMADGTLISAYMCCPESAAEEFETSRLLYERNTGRKQPESRDFDDFLNRMREEGYEVIFPNRIRSTPFSRRRLRVRCVRFRCPISFSVGGLQSKNCTGWASRR